MIAAGVGGAVATVADGLSSTPLVVAVWLLALLGGIVLIVHSERKRKRASSGSETTVLTAIEERDQVGDEGGRRKSLDGAGGAHLGLRQDVRASGGTGENHPTTDFMPVPHSHRRLLDEQAGGDYLIWTPDHPEEEAGPGNEAKVLKLSAGEWLRIGRGTKSDVQFSLDYTPVSRQHAAVKLTEPGILLVRDLGSLNGTWANGEDVATFCRVNGVRAMPVRADADIVVGQTAISYGWRAAVKTRGSGTRSGARSPTR